MGVNFRKVLTSFIFAMILLPTMLLAANTEFKGKEMVNINRADAATFSAYLKGVGANKADAIVKYRKKHGKFKTIDDLNNVPGIGDATYKDIKRNVSTSRGKTSAPQGYTMDRSSGKKPTTRSNRSSSGSGSNRSSGTSSRGNSTSSSSSRRVASSTTNASSAKLKKKKKKKNKKKK